MEIYNIYTKGKKVVPLRGAPKRQGKVQFDTVISGSAGFELDSIHRP